MRFLLMDVGSTFVKYSVYNSDKKEYLLTDRIPFPKPFDLEKGMLVSRAEIDKIIMSVIDIAENYKCKKVFTAVQMHGFILKENEVLSDYYSWQGNDGDVESAELRALDYVRRGTRLKKNLPLARLYHHRAKLSGVEFFTLGSYISYLLTGQNVSHKTDVCASGFFFADSLNGDNENSFGLVLPQRADKVSLCGYYKNIEVYTPVGDHAVSCLGGNADKDTYFLNFGTATQLAFVGGDAPSERWESRPYFDNNTRLITLSGFLSGSAVLSDEAEQKKMCEKLVGVLDTLPRRAKLVFGGGGAAQIFDRIKEMMRLRKTECTMCAQNIGIEGLRMLAESRKTELGMMLSEICFTNMPLLLKKNRFDFMIVDNEHGSFDATALTRLFMVSKLADFTTIVRLPDNSRANITKCADGGADGFLLPMTNTADDIAAVVAYAKYQPIGKRGISTMRAHTLYQPPPLNEYMERANDRMKVYAQIETKAGVDNIADIVAVNGVDGVFVGPNDLSCDLDCIGETAPIIECIKKVAAAANKAGKTWGIITTTKALIDISLELGVNYISYGSELHMLDAECKSIRNKFN